MTVRELRAKLKECDGDAEVFCQISDEWGMGPCSIVRPTTGDDIDYQKAVNPNEGLREGVYIGTSD